MRFYFHSIDVTEVNGIFLVLKMKILWLNQRNHQKRKNRKKRKALEKIFGKLSTMKNLMNERKKHEQLKRNVSNVFYSVNKGKFLKKKFWKFDFTKTIIVFQKGWKILSDQLNCSNRHSQTYQRKVKVLMLSVFHLMKRTVVNPLQNLK